jgi:hypothetical protein
MDKNCTSNRIFFIVVTMKELCSRVPGQLSEVGKILFKSQNLDEKDFKFKSNKIWFNSEKKQAEVITYSGDNCTGNIVNQLNYPEETCVPSSQGTAKCLKKD